MIKGLNIQATNKNERYALAHLINLEAQARELNEEVFVKAFTTFANEIKPNNVEQLETLMAIVTDVVSDKIQEVNEKLANEFEKAMDVYAVEDDVYYMEGYEEEISLMASIENGVINVTMEDTRKANIYGDDTVVIKKSYKTVKGAVKFIEKYL